MIGRPSTDISGERVGMLTVVARAEKPEKARYGSSYWRCRCECGREIIVSRADLRSYKRDCGCQHSAKLAEQKQARMERARQKKASDAQKMAEMKCTQSELIGLQSLTSRKETCPTCGREFEVLSAQWAYKRLVGDRKHQRLRWYCRWRCLREAEQEKPLRCAGYQGI